jgi:BclB C-terminal domain-containing protein
LIAFASGTPINSLVFTNTDVSSVGLVGFGSSTTNAIVSSETSIDLTGNPTAVIDFAFVAPRNGTLTSLYALASVSTISIFSNTGTIHVQLYESTSDTSNTFSPIAATDLSLSPTLPTGNISIGTVVSGNLTGLSVPITAGRRYLLATYLTTTGTTDVDTVAVYLSAGINVI